MNDDLTRCPGSDCPLRSRCVRFRLRAYGRYDSFGGVPYDPVTKGCEHFIDVKTREPTEAHIRDRAYHRWLAAGRPEGTAERDWLEARESFERALRDALYPEDEPGGG